MFMLTPERVKPRRARRPTQAWVQALALAALAALLCGAGCARYGLAPATSEGAALEAAVEAPTGDQGLAAGSLRLHTLAADAHHGLELGQLTLALQERLTARGVAQVRWGGQPWPDERELRCQVTQLTTRGLGQQLQVQGQLQCQQTPSQPGQQPWVVHARSSALLSPEPSSGTLLDQERRLKQRALLLAMDELAALVAAHTLSRPALP